MTTMNGGKNGVRHDVNVAEHREWLRRFDLQREADEGEQEKREVARQRHLMTKAEEHKREQEQRQQALKQLDARVTQHLENWMAVVDQRIVRALETLPIGDALRMERADRRAELDKALAPVEQRCETIDGLLQRLRDERLEERIERERHRTELDELPRL